MIQNSKKRKNAQKKYYFAWSVHLLSISLHHKIKQIKKGGNMKNKKKGTLFLIAGGIVGAVSTALVSWGTFLKSEDDEEKKEESDNVAQKNEGCK
jgi:hypothetical protein